MRSARLAIGILLAAAAAALASAAQPAKPGAGLLIGTDRATASTAAAYNARFIGEHVYFAKRHRIVEIDPAALERSETVPLALFKGGPRIRLVRDTVREGPNPETLVWNGSVDFSGVDFSKVPFAEEDRQKIARLGMTPAELLAELTRVRLFLVNWDVDPASNTAFLSFPPMDSGVALTPGARPPLQNIEKRAFVSLNADIDLSVLGQGIFRIRPLKWSPRYHLVYEVDPAKTFGFKDSPRVTPAAPDQDGRQAERYDEYLRSLPADAPKIVRGVMK